MRAARRCRVSAPGPRAHQRVLRAADQASVDVAEAEHPVAHRIVDVGRDASPPGPHHPRAHQKSPAREAVLDAPGVRGAAGGSRQRHLGHGHLVDSGLGIALGRHLEGDRSARPPSRRASGPDGSGEARLDRRRHATRDAHPEESPPRISAPEALEGAVGCAVPRDEGTGRRGRARPPRRVSLPPPPRRAGTRRAAPTRSATGRSRIPREARRRRWRCRAGAPKRRAGARDIPPIPPHAKDHTPSPRGAVPRRRSGDAVGCWRAACKPQMDTGEGARERRLSPRT